MKEKKNVSSLSDHRVHKKRGIVATPFNDALGDKLTLSSWRENRMPEYLWLGLILMHYGRKEGIERAGRILLEISKSVKSLSQPKLSALLNLSADEQRTVYEIISKHIDKKVLAPLTVLYKNKSYPIFNEYFFISHLTFEGRINIISKAIKLYSPHQSNEATDLRFLALSLLLFNEKISFVSGSDMNTTLKALQEYSNTNHEDDKMRLYRPTVRSMEGTGFTENNTEFTSKFWRDIGMITPCKPIRIDFDKNKEDYDEFIGECQKVLEYVFHSNKEKSLEEDKFDVIIGSINYALKIFEEINGKSLGNSILGRHGMRTIVEIFIILKYLLKKEEARPKIWEEYKLYGISKYKLILLKAREADLDKTSHFIPPIVDALVNEIVWEEFIDVDLKYFDKQNIREKSIEVGEKELFDLFYDYDSSFSHGLWGAIRECAMLHCNNADHRYHSVPDLYSDQNLPDVKSDSVKIMKKLFSVLAEIYDVPKWFTDKYKVNK